MSERAWFAKTVLFVPPRKRSNVPQFGRPFGLFEIPKRAERPNWRLKCFFSTDQLSYLDKRSPVKFHNFQLIVFLQQNLYYITSLSFSSPCPPPKSLSFPFSFNKTIACPNTKTSTPLLQDPRSNQKGLKEVTDDGNGSNIVVGPYYAGQCSSRAKDYPKDDRPEFSILGRSNVAY
ncbi:GTP-binding protein [Corchorus capsularis]|uniref:GTP-binding protein n=1 Tax=Corchorus capsularis TaxID=210143 RepID=A0A1R3G3K4_COCAP|nr:GTP-binding protein [Corchorus capsularis]